MTAQPAGRDPFDHVIITRFTANFIPDQDPPDDDWSFYRLGFFFDGAYPSIKGQGGHHRPFQWLVFLDDRCSDDFRRVIDEISPGVFQPIWTHEVFWNVVSRVVGERTSASHLITTRLDNDDVVARDFVATIQAHFRPVDRLTLNFPRGLQMDRRGRIYEYSEPSGPFQSLIEARQPSHLPSTVFAEGRHARARASSPIMEIQAPPMWMQVVHGTNIANEIRGVRVAPGVVAERFATTLTYDTSVSRRRLIRESLDSYARRIRLWLRHPYYFFEWLDAAMDRRRGTHIKPQRPGVIGPPLAGWTKARYQRIRRRATRVD